MTAVLTAVEGRRNSISDTNHTRVAQNVPKTDIERILQTTKSNTRRGIDIVEKNYPRLEKATQIKERDQDTGIGTKMTHGSIPDNDRTTILAQR